MNHDPNISIICAILAAGLAQASEPTTLEPSRGTVSHVGHIYYNAATGERVVTLAGADAGAGSVPIWSSTVATPCAAAGYSTTYYFAVDNPGTTSLSTGATLSDIGDIASDTVVDCLQVNWVTAHRDTDADGDGVGDGVEGLAGQWGVWDLDNGRGLQCLRLPLVLFQISDLPGHIGDPGELSSFTATIDLRSDLDGVDMSFEICDTDGNCQDAAFCNSNIDTNGDGIGDGAPIGSGDWNFDGMPDSDLDGDGLSDWGWTVRFVQPGTEDIDGDGQVDGQPAGVDSDTIGVDFGAPEGMAIEHPDGTWSWEVDTSAYAAGTGAEDGFAFYTPPDQFGIDTFAGTFNFGGFACTGGLISTGGTGYTPPAMFRFALFGPSDADCCPSDYNCDGELDFFDVSQFITDYNGMMPDADINGDGAWDFFDVSQFITAFNTGCP
ncbi:MAG: GC-type dockerin domain-anchored protein [Phycisphaerales bacterium]